MAAYYASVGDLNNQKIMQLLRDTREIKERVREDKRTFLDVCAGRMMGMMFYEPSTRTSGSFAKAMTYLGGLIYEFNIAASSIAKGESLDDTARMVAMESDLLVVRHKKAGTTRHLAEETLDIPVLNAGEGTGEHPTQALLDVFTIWETFGYPETLEGITIGFYGDLAHGRTCHSLIKLASRLGANFVCIAPEEALQMPDRYIEYGEGEGATVCRTDDINAEIAGLDVLYVTRLQRERLPDELHHHYNEQKSDYGVTPELLKNFPEKSIVMHPLPRLDELDARCDKDPRAAYFKQANNGIFARMALIMHYLDLSNGHLMSRQNTEPRRLRVT